MPKTTNAESIPLFIIIGSAAARNRSTSGDNSPAGRAPGSSADQLKLTQLKNEGVVRMTKADILRLTHLSSCAG
jgi:hypothetical protein